MPNKDNDGNGQTSTPSSTVDTLTPTQNDHPQPPLGNPDQPTLPLLSTELYSDLEPLPEHLDFDPTTITVEKVFEKLNIQENQEDWNKKQLEILEKVYPNIDWEKSTPKAITEKTSESLKDSISQNHDEMRATSSPKEATKSQDNSPDTTFLEKPLDDISKTEYREKLHALNNDEEYKKGKVYYVGNNGDGGISEAKQETIGKATNYGVVAGAAGALGLTLFGLFTAGMGPLLVTGIVAAAVLTPLLARGIGRLACLLYTSPSPRDA